MNNKTKDSEIKSIDKVKEYIDILDNFKMPEYKELADIPLYMEQVVSYIEGVLLPILNDKPSITPFMVNNYVKAKIVDAPENKKYSKDHVAYLLAISILKQSCSMKDIATFIELDKYKTLDKQKLYEYFTSTYEEVLKNQVHRVKIRLDAINKEEKKINNTTKKNKKELDEKDKLDNSSLLLSIIALRLFIESLTSKMIGDTIMNSISPIIFNKEVLDETKKEKKIVNKKEHKEAKRLASRK